MKPYYQHGGIAIYHGDCREIMPQLNLKVDVVITDPPYSSGGAMRSDRNLATADKYRLTGTVKVDPDFSGDNRDQRSFMFWCSDWMAQSLAQTRRGGALLCFIDWRNLPCVIDAVQVGGWVYRGILAWDKTEGARRGLVERAGSVLWIRDHGSGFQRGEGVRLSGLRRELIGVRA